MKEKRKKILFVITKGNWGGAQRYVYDMATSISATYEVVVVLGRETLLQEKLEDAGIRAISISTLQRDINPFKEIVTIWKLWRILKRESPDVVHLNSSKAGGIGALLSRVIGIPLIVFTAHGWAFHNEQFFLVRYFVKTLHWITILLSHITIAVSTHIKCEMETLPCIQKKIRIIHPGIKNISFFDKTEARSFLGKKIKKDLQETFVLGTIAELHSVKDYETALRAFQKFHAVHRNSVYIIVGDGDEKEILQSYVDSLGIEKYVHFVGFLENAPAYMKAFDAFLLTSKREAFGYVLLEAGLAEIPIIATRTGGIPEIISSEEYGTLVNIGDSDTVKDTLVLLSKNHTLYTPTIMKSRVVGNFSKKQMVEKTESIYKNT